MLYREAGQFKSSYAADSAIMPIRQDRIALVLILLVAFVGIPLTASPYLFSAILIPALILALAALGLNILTGYAGQLSLGTAAFMAVGAFAWSTCPKRSTTISTCRPTWTPSDSIRPVITASKSSKT